jgi:hypothetical protein
MPMPDAGDTDMAAPIVDMAVVDPSMILPGAAGAPCAGPDDCFRLKSNPVCFSKNLFNTGITYPTPGGYCSQRCETDTDCGSNGRCFEFDRFGKWCFSACSDSKTCRHPGYACTLDFQICFPDAGFDCDPTQNQGRCEAQVEVDPLKPKLPGGCLRQAHEDKGICSPECKLGQNCPINLVSRQPTQCVYLDTTVDLMLQPTRDRWKGLTCVPQGVFMLDGKPCSFFEDCFPGSQCDLWPGGDGKCHPQCQQGGMPACMAGQSCTDALRAGPGGPGLCK